MRSFAELLTEYMTRTGVSDTELARYIGVRRQTIFRWKEGLVKRPRHRDDVLRCAAKLRLTPEERDALLVAAGFPPEDASTVSAGEDTPVQTTPASSAQIEEMAVSRVDQLMQRMSPLKWRVVVATLVMIGLLLVTAWLVRSPTYPVAAEGETLIIAGRFVNFAGAQQSYNVAGRVRDALNREVETAQLAGVRIAVWPETISDESAARAAGRRSGARIVIWGEYDSGRALARFTIPGSYSGLDEPRLEQLVATPADLSATINTDLPAEVRYVALLTLGQLYIDAEDFDQAQIVLTQALDPPPSEPDAQARLYFYLGYVYQQEEPPDLDQAIESYSQAVALQPGLVWAYNNRGVAYRHHGRLDQAVADLTQAIALMPDNATPYNNRGAAYLQRGGPSDLVRAVEDFSRAIELAPDASEAYSNRGAAYLRRGEPGDLARAVEDFDRAVALAPDAPEAYFNRGLAYVRQGKHKRWLEDFEHVLALDPDHAGAHNALCWAYALEQQPDMALPYCDRAVALDPTGFSHDSRGIVHAELGRLEKAIADFEAFLSWLRQQPESMYQHYGPKREAWLQTLKKGQSPFDSETLANLRQE